MNFVTKYFDELNTKELYELLKARAEVFVVEQNCVYQDLDDNDYRSLHMFYEEDGKILAYLRAFRKSDEPDTVHVGRVLTIARGTGLGGKLLHEAIKQVRNKMDPKQIFIGAQSYATGFYAREGFRITSDEYIEDGIPHFEMRLDLS